MNFRLNILADFHWESYIGKVLDIFSEIKYRDYFSHKDYGTSLNEIVLGLICHHSSLNLKQRVRFSKKEKILYADIMLDFDYVKSLSDKERVKYVADKIKSEVPPIISKYKFKDFNLEKFEKDLNLFISKLYV